MRSTTLDATEAPPPRNVVLDSANFHETIIATLPRRGGSRLEILVRRRTTDGACHIGIRHFARTGRHVTLEVFAFEAEAMLDALSEAREILRAVATAPMGAGR